MNPRSLKLSMAALALPLAAMLSFAGCQSGGGSNVHWYAPTTWPIFSGESKVNAAGKAEAKADAARRTVESTEDVALHAAHLEFFKVGLSLQAIAQTKAADLARRFNANGLGILDQFDPLTAVEASAAREVVADFMSDSLVKVANAEKAQLSVEKANSEISRKLADETKRADKSAAEARSANAAAHSAALENIEIANELRTYRWAALWLMLAVVAFGGFILYLRMQLGGIGEGLHALGAPKSVLDAIERRTSSLGQWFVHTGRIAAAKTEAVLKAKVAPVDPA